MQGEAAARMRYAVRLEEEALEQGDPLLPDGNAAGRAYGSPIRTWFAVSSFSDAARRGSGGRWQCIAARRSSNR